MADQANPKQVEQKPWYVKLGDYVVYLLFVGFERFIRALPKKTATKFMRGMGYLWYITDIRHYKVAMHNLRLAFSAEKPPHEIKRICKACFMHLGETVADMIHGIKITRENKDEYFTYEGTEMVDRELPPAMATNHGVVAISAHLGSQEMLIGHLMKYGVGKESIVTKRILNPYIDRYIQGWREKMGVHVIPHRRNAKEIIARMKKGEIIVFLLDQRASTHEGVRVKFFGEYVIAHKAIAQLALAFNLFTVPIFVPKMPDGRYKVTYGDILKLNSTGNFDADTILNTQMFQDIIEAMVRKYPEQWLWVHNRWKHGTPGESI